MDGLSNKQIAGPGSPLPAPGIKRHVAGLLFKLECTNRTQAVALALREGLLG